MPQVLEGIWEEMRGHDELAGQRVRITVLPDNDQTPTLDQMLAGRTGRVRFNPASLSEDTGKAFSNVLLEKQPKE
jgi:hypothetical protein